MICSVLVPFLPIGDGNSVKSFLVAFYKTLPATDAFVRVDDQGVAIGFGRDHGDGMKTTDCDTLLAIGAFGLVDGVKVGRAFAGIDEDEGGNGQ
jgi:hypothetical protein